mmetsp:Transcript_21823/g.53967  ORF Transcript_21823/g.53967 Transcript_21823/m.53967 type:complete len:126 (+) Transcript_21823:975-1352(+)
MGRPRINGGCDRKAVQLDQPIDGEVPYKCTQPSAVPTTKSRSDAAIVEHEVPGSWSNHLFFPLLLIESIVHGNGLLLVDPLGTCVELVQSATKLSSDSEQGRSVECTLFVLYGICGEEEAAAAIP